MKIKYLYLTTSKFFRIIFCFLILLLNIQCSQYNFLPSGTVIKEVPIYYNDSLKLSLETFGDYVEYNDELKHGFKVDGLYSGDKAILKSTRLDPSKMRMLFSGIPNGEPLYHLIAFVSKEEKLIKENSSLIPKKENDSVRYYYKMYNFKEWRVYQTIIPIDQGTFNFVYYQKQSDSCVYCDIESLSLRASKMLISGNDNNHSNGTNANFRDVRIEIPKDNVLNKAALLKLYNNEGKVLISFKFLKKGNNTSSFKVSKGSYIISYTDLNNNVKWRKELIVN